MGEKLESVMYIFSRLYNATGCIIFSREELSSLHNHSAFDRSFPNSSLAHTHTHTQFMFLTLRFLAIATPQPTYLKKLFTSFFQILLDINGCRCAIIHNNDIIYHPLSCYFSVLSNKLFAYYAGCSHSHIQIQC